ncbi:MAG TPA: DUF6263 family protein [Kofleriaceae bacterium]|nr:DUF6263 family protein [Kofleriaceae bacterium]
MMRQALAATLVLAATAACGGGTASAPRPVVSNTPSEPIVEEKTDAGQPRIEIVSLGAQPRQALRLRPTVGTAAGADVAIEMTTRLGAPATETSFDMSFGWTGGVMSAGEAIRVENRFDRLEMGGGPTEHGQVGFTYTLLPTAAVASFDVLAEAPGMMDAALAESARQTLAWLVVFPQTPVGIGARWRVETEYVQAGTPVTMTMTFELVAHTRDRATIRGAMTFRSAPDQPAFVEGTGAVDVEVDLTRVVPTSKLTLAFTGVVKTDTTTKVAGESTMTLTPRR